MIQIGDYQMSPEQISNAEETARTLLLGTTLDHFRVYSLILNLDFLRMPMAGELPADIWLSASGQATFLETSAAASYDMSAAGRSDFFKTRKKILEEIYPLIGKKIMAVGINPSGTLELAFETGSLLFSGGQTDLEQIWSITSDTSEPYGNQDWSVTLTDRQELVTHRP